MTAAADFIDCIPKDDVAEHLRWRSVMAEAARRDAVVRRALRTAALDDILFFFNAFLWVHEPRAAIKTKPFITWPHQDPVILGMDLAIVDAQRTREPLSFKLRKSRAQGGTYLYLGVDIYHAIKGREFKVGLVTRNEGLVDSKVDSDTIMYKLCWMLDRLPMWLLPGGYTRNLTDHTVVLVCTSSAFTGYSATADVGRGGRKTKFDCDEIGSEEFIAGGKDYKVMSSISSVSDCTFLVSTYGADSGVFYEATTDPEEERVYTLDWKDNPTQTKHAYVMRDGVAYAVRPEEQTEVTAYAKAHARLLRRLERRGHVIEGKFRSPWYDAFCSLPGSTPRYVARELDMDPRGAVGKLFDIDVLDRMKKDCCKQPIWVGKPVFDGETLELKGLIRQENGPLKLWFTPGLDDQVPVGRYGVGCDISAGGISDQSSNSVASGISLSSGEQVCEYTVRGMHAQRFARVACGLAKWLRNACLSWETTGPTGTNFGREVTEVVYYPNLFMRDVDALGDRAKSKKPGWSNNKAEDKANLFEALCIAMDDGEYIPRSEDLVRECGEYEWVNGKIVHRPSKDGGMEERAHADRAVAAGVAYLILSDMRVGVDRSSPIAQDEPPYGCMAWRIAEADRIERARMREAEAIGGLSGLLKRREGGWLR